MVGVDVMEEQHADPGLRSRCSASPALLRSSPRTVRAAAPWVRDDCVPIDDPGRRRMQDKLNRTGHNKLTVTLLYKLKFVHLNKLIQVGRSDQDTTYDDDTG